MSKIVLSEDQIKALFEESCKHHQQGEFEKAEKSYLTLLAYYPDAFLLNYNLGLIYQETNRYQEAIEKYLVAEKDNPNEPDLIFNTALCYKKIGHIEEAISAFKSCLVLTPDSIDTLYSLAECYRSENQLTEAAHCYQKALALNSDYQPAISNLAYTYQRLGEKDNALKLYERLIEIHPDHKGAKHMIATIKGTTLEYTDNQYTTELFDNYAEDFEKDLVQNLKYQVPQLLRDILFESIDSTYRFNTVLDLGCGTGLAGEKIKANANKLVGIDLSTKMLDIAFDKGIYDELYPIDIVEFLNNSTDSYDLFIAADVFSYIGKLEETFSAIVHNAAKSSLICFSVEIANKDINIELGSTGRFKHSEKYIENLCEKLELQILRQSQIEMRQEAGEWVKGVLFVLQKSN